MARVAVLETLFHTVVLQPETLHLPKQENLDVLALVQKSIQGITSIRKSGSIV